MSSCSPKSGLGGDVVSVSGTGLTAATTVTVGGVEALVTLRTSAFIRVIAPSVGAGPADVVVTNPGGERATAPACFTYEALSLLASQDVVASGGSLSVNWVAPGSRSEWDWIGFFKLGQSSTNYENGWWRYTKGAASGTLTLSAPDEPGQYEFRYLLDDGFIEVGRSGQVTVTR